MASLRTGIKLTKNSQKLLSSDFLLSRLSLTYRRYEEYNGTWYHIYKNHFDLFMLEVRIRESVC